jgi:hypothetical protein
LISLATFCLEGSLKDNSSSKEISAMSSISSLSPIHPKSAGFIAQGAFSSQKASLPDSFTLRFSGASKKRIDINLLNERERLELHRPDQLICLGKIYAKGLRGVKANPQKAEYCFELATKSGNLTEQAYAGRQVAQIYIQGYHSIRPNPQKTLTYLQKIVQSAQKDYDGGHYSAANACMQMIEHLYDGLHYKDRQNALETVGSAPYMARYPDLADYTARFFAKVMEQPDKAAEFARLAAEKYQSYNRYRDSIEEPNKDGWPRRGIMYAHELFDLAQDMATGQNGFQKDPKTADILLQALVDTFKVPNPYVLRDAAKLYAVELGDKEKATQILNQTLKAKYPNFLEAIEIMARDVGDVTAAKVLAIKGLARDHGDYPMAAAQWRDPENWSSLMLPNLVDPKNFGDRVTQARILARYFDRKEDALQVVTQLCQNEKLSEHRPSECIELAEVFAKDLQDEAKAREVLSSVKHSTGEEKLALADAYLTQLHDTDNALKVVDDILDKSLLCLRDDKMLEKTLTLLERVDPENPEATRLKQKVHDTQAAVKERDEFS